MEEENDSSKFIIIICTCFVFTLVILILTSKQISKKQYNDGYFSDLYENLNLNPISKIELKSKNNSFNGTYKNLITETFSIYNWKGNYIEIERIDSNYINLIENENNLFEIGTDSLGNKLYSDKKVF